MFNPDALSTECSGQSGKVTIFLKIHGRTLLITVGGDLVSNAQIIQNVPLDRTPTMARIRVELDLH
jgi:hypothetical protein